MDINVVSIKGRGSGLIEIRFAQDIAYQQIREGFVDKLSGSKAFFQGSNPKVIIWGREMNKAQKWDIRNLLAMDYDITNVKFEDELDEDEMELISGSEVSEPNQTPIRKVSDLSVKTFLGNEDDFEKMMDEEERAQHEHAKVFDHSVFLYSTIRSGQRIEVEGDITVIGDVNDGAEVFATGSIAVMGALRGLVHAGSQGENSAVVSAVRLTPKQMRIGTRIAAFPEGQSGKVPEIARVINDKIVVAPLLGRGTK